MKNKPSNRLRLFVIIFLLAIIASFCGICGVGEKQPTTISKEEMNRRWEEQAEKERNTANAQTALLTLAQAYADTQGILNGSFQNLDRFTIDQTKKSIDRPEWYPDNAVGTAEEFVILLQKAASKMFQAAKDIEARKCVDHTIVFDSESTTEGSSEQCSLRSPY